MPFKEGKPKTGGREKGVVNKRTAEQTQRIERVLSLLDDTLDEDIKSLPPRERVVLWKDLQEFIRPKLARTEMKHEGEVSLKQITGMEVK